jgi:hypothetical protein
MNKFEWVFNPQSNVEYYYNTSTGMVLGQCHPIAHSIVYVAKVWVSPVQERMLGQYVSMQFAKSAIELFWDAESRTFIENH